MKRAWIVLAVALGGVAQWSCNVNDYCLNCLTGDGGRDSGSGLGDATDGGDGDASDGGPCIPTGPEICDGKDNDCNGLVDDGVLPGVGDLCANQMGECAGGVQQCTNGALTCTKKPSPEICDNKDNDCNGLVDEGDPGGGGKCGTDVGECVAGVNHCVAGTIQCQGAIGGTSPPFGTAEICDGKDNDCDGSFDEGLTSLGTCGVSNVGICKLGTITCVGGVPQCDGDPVAPGIQPPQGPLFEVCNGLDDDCDGTVDEGFDLMNDPQNCGSCGTVCGSTMPNSGNAVWACSAGACVIASCDAGYHDNNNSAADGCEFGPCFSSGVEVCDGVDNDCDGSIDEDIGTPPAICPQVGECLGSTASCQGVAGWVCDYGPTVSQVGGVIQPETKCDGLDNDCNGTIDDHQPNLGEACTDGALGICQSSGTYICDSTNLNGPAVCNFTHTGGTATAESCNNQDDDCDGIVDEGGTTGSLVGQNWVTLPNGTQMMQFEASKPDSTSTDEGAVQTLVCSQAGVQPWVNVKYPDAAAACSAIGARLCTAQEWHHACAVTQPAPTLPVSVVTTGTLIEAEDYKAIAYATSSSVTRSWIEDYTIDTNNVQYSGISNMVALPNTGVTVAIGSANGQAPRLDYSVSIPTAGTTWHVYVKIFGAAPAAGLGNNQTVYVGVGTVGTAGPITPTATALNTSTNVWQWIDAGAFKPDTGATLAAGNHTISVYMADDGVRLDAIYVVQGTTTTFPAAAAHGNTWAYASSPNTYNGATCNGQDFSAANDNVLTTGFLGGSTLTSCNAAIGTGIYDMSGNVKEWVQAEQPGENPLRGGASNNTGAGISCPLNFTLADDTFFFPNVGFRCCR